MDGSNVWEYKNETYSSDFVKGELVVTGTRILQRTKRSGKMGGRVGDTVQ